MLHQGCSPPMQVDSAEVGSSTAVTRPARSDTPVVGRRHENISPRQIGGARADFGTLGTHRQYTTSSPARMGARSGDQTNLGLVRGRSKALCRKCDQRDPRLVLLLSGVSGDSSIFVAGRRTGGGATCWNRSACNGPHRSWPTPRTRQITASWESLGTPRNTATIDGRRQSALNLMTAFQAASKRTGDALDRRRSAARRNPRT